MFARYILSLLCISCWKTKFNFTNKLTGLRTFMFILFTRSHFYLLTCVLPVVFILTLKPKFTKSWVRLNIAVIFSFSGFLFLKWDVLTGIAAIYLKDFSTIDIKFGKALFITFVQYRYFI